MAERADDLKDMLRALQRFAGAKKLQMKLVNKNIKTLHYENKMVSPLIPGAVGVAFNHMVTFTLRELTLQ